MALSFPVTGLYAALLALLFVYLSLRIPPLRYKHKAGIGDGGADELARAVRVHGNFAEYTPLALILIGLGEANGGHAYILHGLGALFLASRVGHAIALTRSRGASKLRFISMVSTFAVLIIGAGALLWGFIGGVA